MALAHTRTGSGDPLVLIHGLGGSRRIWDPLIDRVAEQRGVVAADLPGFGESPELPDDVAPTAANRGAAVGELCAELGIERPHVAGNSLGAWAALELAKGGEVASVCGISPAGLWRRPLGPRRVDSHAWALRVRRFVPVLLASRRQRVRCLRSTVARPERLSDEEGKALIADWLNARAYEAANVEMRSHVFEDPELVEVPTTIAWGTADVLVGRPRRERMPPGARYVELDGLGHTPTWDDPDRVAELLLDASAQSSVESGRSSPGQAPVDA